MASREIEIAFTALTSGAALIEAERRQVKSLAQREFQHLSEQKKRAQAAGIQSGPVLQNMSFHDIDTGKHVFYAFKDFSYDDLISALAVSHNRQYQWLLAEAFELLEDFLIDAYGCAGATDPSIWLPKHLGAVGDYRGKSVSWWVDKARAHRRPSVSARLAWDRLRLLPGVRDAEVSNAHQIDFKLTLLMIERMRHVIVHNRGQVSSKRDFATNVAKEAGRLPNGSPYADDLDFLQRYIGEGELDRAILLLDYPLPPKGPLHMYHDVFGELLGWMLAHAHMLAQRI